MATPRRLHPVARLLEALETEKVRYMLIGMSAAIVQGVMETTLDVDLWIDLPSRQYVRVQNFARSIGCTPAANTVVYTSDGTPVNFVFEVGGHSGQRSARGQPSLQSRRRWNRIAFNEIHLHTLRVVGVSLPFSRHGATNPCRQ